MRPYVTRQNSMKDGGGHVTMFRQLWQKFAQSKRYREQFVAAQVKQAIPFQIRILMKEKGLSQADLAVRAGLTQGAISRAANPKYGNLSLNTLVRIAAGFDVAFVGRFVPFSELTRWLHNLHEESRLVPTFDEELELMHQAPDVVAGSSARQEARIGQQRSEKVERFYRLTAPNLVPTAGRMLDFRKSSSQSQNPSASQMAVAQ